jgi:hypothetical protein
MQALSGHIYILYLYGSKKYLYKSLHVHHCTPHSFTTSYSFNILFHPYAHTYTNYGLTHSQQCPPLFISTNIFFLMIILYTFIHCCNPFQTMSYFISMIIFCPVIIPIHCQSMKHWSSPVARLMQVFFNLYSLNFLTSMFHTTKTKNWHVLFNDNVCWLSCTSYLLCFVTT